MRPWSLLETEGPTSWYWEQHFPHLHPDSIRRTASHQSDGLRGSEGVTPTSWRHGWWVMALATPTPTLRSPTLVEGKPLATGWTVVGGAMTHLTHPQMQNIPVAMVICYASTSFGFRSDVPRHSEFGRSRKVYTWIAGAIGWLIHRRDIPRVQPVGIWFLPHLWQLPVRISQRCLGVHPMSGPSRCQTRLVCHKLTYIGAVEKESFWASI